MAVNLVQVETFCSNAPQRSPTTFTYVSAAISTSPSKCARVTTTPANATTT